MSIYDESASVEDKLEKAKLRQAKHNKETHSGAHNVKENVVGMARNIKDTSVDTAHVAADYVRHRMDDLRTSGTDTLEKVESRIQSRPAQSLAIAFVAGLLASFLLGRRSS